MILRSEMISTYKTTDFSKVVRHQSDHRDGESLHIGIDDTDNRSGRFLLPTSHSRLQNRFSGRPMRVS